MKRIILTGGGTAGHVILNIALLPALINEGYDIHYIGSKEGIERKLIEELNIPYYGISTGKLRRYLDVKNLTDPFKVIKGYFEANDIIKKLKPNILFSKGGFVSVPVVLAARRKGVPCIIHESDISPGLANKICLSSAVKVCCNFPETIKYLPKNKAVLTGSPIRDELLKGNKLNALKLCNFNTSKPILLVIGGSTGSVIINEAVRKCLPILTTKYQVIHICGKGKVDDSLMNTKAYIQFEYVNKEFSDLLTSAEVVVSRAGANSICEFLALKKPNILIPLSARVSRGDQILNSESFRKQGYSYVIKEEELTPEVLTNAIDVVYTDRASYIDAMARSKLNNSIGSIIQIIKEVEKS